MQLPQQYPAFSICPSCIDGPDVLYPRLDVTPRAVVVGAEGGIDEFLEDEEDELDDEDDAQDDADCGDEVEVLDDDEDADDDEDEDEDADRGDEVVELDDDAEDADDDEDEDEDADDGGGCSVEVLADGGVVLLDEASTTCCRWRVWTRSLFGNFAMFACVRARYSDLSEW